MLREELIDWTDWDIAAHCLAVNLGLLPAKPDFGGQKWIFWSDNELGNFLHSMLNQMAEIGILEKRDEPDIQFRFAKSFKIETCQ